MLRNLLIYFLTFGIYYFLDARYFNTLQSSFTDLTGHLGLSHILTYAISGIPLFIGTWILTGNRSLFQNFGLNKSFLRGLIFALICTLPMFVGFSLLFELNTQLSINTLLISVAATGFFEELYFRGYLYGQLYKNTKLGFLPSVLLGALLFGAVHLYQSSEVTELIGIFLITFLGGILFAWVYTEWDHNIWFPVFLHALMNLSWELFSVSDNALGDSYSNLFRILTIALVIIITRVYKRKKGIPMQITKKTLFMKNSPLNEPS